jgi:tol-pal system beta propeller repeat protein TolB
MNSSNTRAAPRRLTHDGKRKLTPAFAPGDREVVFAVHEVPNLVALQRLHIANATRARLHPSLTAHQFDPAFSADGHYHAFVMSSTSPQLVLVIQDTRHKTETVFRPRDARATARSPSFAPDGSRVVFSLSDVGGHRIASVNVQGQDLRILAESPGMNCWPSYSADGKKIAFGSSRGGNFQVCVMNADGSDVRRVTKGPGMARRPAWSPDGRRLAFTGNRDGGDQVYVMTADGSDLCRITPHAERADYPVWHPDGRHLLVVAEQGGRSDLYLVALPD